MVATIAPSLSPAQRALLDGEYGNMLSCVRCGLCLTSCPTYVLSMREAEGPRGRVAMARALAEGHLQVTPDLIEHEQNCLVCDACTAVCPAGVHMDPLQVALRTAIAPDIQRRTPLWQRAVRAFVFRRLFPSMRTFRVVVRLLWVYQRSGLQRLVRATRLLTLLGLDQSEAFLPQIADRFLVPDGRVYPADEVQELAALVRRDGPPATAEAALLAPRAGTTGSTGAARTTVSFFAGCVMSTALAEIDRASIRVLQRAGCDVIVTANQGCCGALNAHGGDLPAAREMAKRVIAAFEADGDTEIVVNSAGCGAMLKDYAHHFRDDPAWASRAAAFSARVKDATELLAGRSLPVRRGIEGTVTYQEPCHLAHAQRITKQPRALLTAVPGLQLREMAESALCCGSAGVYNVTNPGESRRLQRRKLDNALAIGAETIVTANPGCLLQLQSGLAERGSAVKVKHIMELLDEVTAPTSPPPPAARVPGLSTEWRGGVEPRRDGGEV